MTSKLALEILENRNGALHINNLIGSRRLANEEIKEIATMIDKLIKEAFRPLVERDTPMLPIKRKMGQYQNYYYVCPKCEEMVSRTDEVFCKDCGQRLELENE